MLLRILREREPDLHEHLGGVAALAVEMGRKLELGGERARSLARAAELHDVGKLAIPDRDPAQARPAQRRRMGADALAHGDRLADPRRGAGDGAGGRARALTATSAGTASGYPDRLSGRRDPARIADHLRLRRVRGDDHRSCVPLGDDAEIRRSPSSALLRNPVRPALVEQFRTEIYPQIDASWPAAVATNGGVPRSRS